MAVKWDKKDVVERIQVAMNETQNPPSQTPNAQTNLLERLREAKQKRTI